MSRHLVHRAGAALIALFVLFHLINHLVLWGGTESHLVVMEALRAIYRWWPIEVLLITAIVLQIATGVRHIWKRGRPKTSWAWAQVISGGFLTFFLVQHVPAVFFARLVSGIDTNVWFAASVAVTDPLRYYFLPYYTLGVLALFIHLTCAAHFVCGNRAPALPAGLMVVGVLVSLAIILPLSGAVFPIELPQQYLDYLTGQYGSLLW